jgi:hypothetical protein
MEKKNIEKIKTKKKFNFQNNKKKIFIFYIQKFLYNSNLKRERYQRERCTK